MLSVIQRVLHAHVEVDGQTIAKIEHGIVALLAIEKGDGAQQAENLINKVLNYRIFADADDKMNLSLRDCAGGLLLAPQFTLAADTQKGLRPSFAPAAPPQQAEELFELALQYARQHHNRVESGQFAANMAVHLCNDGPVTFILKNS